MPKTLTIIGCGKVAQTLARLWHVNGLVVINDILNTSIASANRAIDFIGAGTAAENFGDLRVSDIVLIATPDDRIASCCDALAQTKSLSNKTIVFHCSGALPSTVLQNVQPCGAAIASIHPIRSFASPQKVVQNFSGTYCGVEGDQSALDELGVLFSAIGAYFVLIDREQKILYHAAAVFASNYLVTLLDTAVQSYGKAGIPQNVALKMMASLVQETTENVLQSEPEQALTGPIARGDVGTVIRQYRAVKKWDKRYGSLYKQLGKLTLRLAHRHKPRG
jgi:predicted short-subunit dehydrogenase-like oxidoreductase (DUF2520 family)